MALDLDGDTVSDVLLLGGRLQRRRLPSGVVLRGDGDGDDAGLDGWRRITVDAGRQLAEGYYLGKKSTYNLEKMLLSWLRIIKK